MRTVFNLNMIISRYVKEICLDFPSTVAGEPGSEAL